MIRLEKLTSENRYEFAKTLEEILTYKFNCHVDDLPKNYSRNWEWGLLNLIENGRLTDYCLLYLNDKIWAGSGGRVRNFNGKKIYQVAFRAFSCATDQYKALGMKSLFHKYMTLEQIANAKKYDCQQVIMSYNENSKRLFEITHKYILPRALPDLVWHASTEPVIFNTVPQWLIIHDL